jgi:hypothetical protein
MPPDGVSVRLLGLLEVERGGAPISLGGHAQRALLVRLLLDAKRTYALEIDPDALDLVRFERLCKERRPREALALWRATS